MCEDTKNCSLIGYAAGIFCTGIGGRGGVMGSYKELEGVRGSYRQSRLAWELKANTRQSYRPLTPESAPADDNSL